MALPKAMRKMESVWNQKTNYQYWLANGECMEYSLSPDCSLVQVIDGLVASYYATQFPNSATDEVWVQPYIAAKLNKECMTRFAMLLGNISNPVGTQVLRLQTVAGPVTIVAKSDLAFPIFIGSEQELKDNDFNTLLEGYLCE